MNRTIAKSRARDTSSAQGEQPTLAQLKYLRLGLDQPGGKLPLFGKDGRKIDARTVKACLEKGWCERWYRNPIKPDWLVCRLTDAGRCLLEEQ